jgi:hypothetical protein
MSAGLRRVKQKAGCAYAESENVSLFLLFLEKDKYTKKNRKGSERSNPGRHDKIFT